MGAFGTRVRNQPFTPTSFLEPNSPSILSRIARRGLHKIAALRDPRGQLFLNSAACSHLGCHMHWNSFEACWDPPCHGSHFAPDGTATNAPAVARLEPSSE